MPTEFLFHAARSQTLALGTEPFAILADGDRTDGRLTCVEVWVPPGGGPPLHRHAREDEAFYVLEGTLGLAVEGEQLTVPAGSFAWAPRHRAHRFFNSTSQPVRMLVFMVPAGIEGAFRAASSPVPAGTRVAPAPDTAGLAAFMAACAEHEIDLDPRSAGPAPRSSAYVLSPASAETLSMVGDVYYLLATAAQTDGQFYLHEALIPPGGGPPPHIHTREDEAFYILSGTLSLEVEGRRHQAGSGTFVWAPRHQKHRFVNESSEEVRCLVLALPAGVEGMFRTCGSELPAGSTTPVPVTPEAIGWVLEQCPLYGITIALPDGVPPEASPPQP